MKCKTGIIILAAGSSSRLGSPKQLLQYNAQSLIKRIVNEALTDSGHLVVVVTGANAGAVKSEIEYMDILTCVNKYWESGMGSSVAAGLKCLLHEYPETEQCIICVSDQPFVTDNILQDLKREQVATGKGIVGSRYSGITGVPALFTKPYFNILINMRGEKGAKAILQKYSEDVCALPFDEGTIDIDTVEDYNRLINKE